jgi:hypothetical protein
MDSQPLVNRAPWSEVSQKAWAQIGGESCSVRLRTHCSRLDQRFIAAVTLTGVALFGAAFFAM